MAAWPHFEKPNPLSALRVLLWLSVVLAAAALSQFSDQIIAEELFFTSARFRSALYAGYGLLAVLALLASAALTPLGTRLLAGLQRLQSRLQALGPAALALFAGVAVAMPLIAFGFYGRFVTGGYTRLLLFWTLAAVGAALLAAWRRSSWLSNLAGSLLVIASVYLTGTFLVMVQSYPFSLEWSEISRYYQASMFFDQALYGINLPWPVTHPSRYMLQSLPFLLPGSALWLHRLWQAVLWVGMPLLTAWLLARRLQTPAGYARLLFVLWGFLFLMQGAVFYHLLPCVFLVLIGFDSKRLGRTLLFVALASIWAGLSRINWVPLPGALAALLYFIEVRPKAQALSPDYLWRPALFTVGGSLAGLGAYAFYILNSGNPPEHFGSSFTSALLWARLWPNAAFPPGILPGIVLVSLPLLALLALRLRQPGSGLGQWRWLGVAALLLIFFAGGLVVSVKIGGGTNLHNMDAYMVLLLTLAYALAVGRYAPQAAGKLAALSVPVGLQAALLLIPIGFAIFSGGPLKMAPEQETAQLLQQIQTEADKALANGSQVLFISQRHLVTFGLVEGVPLYPDYEKLFLMEMAISHNEDYLARFAKLVDEHRFGLIVTDPLYDRLVDENQDPLAAENNAWVEAITRTILCAYEPVATSNNPSVQLLVPHFPKCDDR
ncbi:MAG: hypothetical protein KIT46_05910 [Anaerolineales bacterium]|nr:hypothetical protein [Anaerolineales bacterium]MCW5855567.1 hypothetical protein [Anaerolineales bacterium]